MNRSSFALFVALLIHFLFLLLFLRLSAIAPETKSVVPEEKKIRVSLRELPQPKKQVKKNDIANQKVKPLEKTKIAPPMPKGKQLKKLVTKPPVVYKPKKAPKVPKLNPKSTPVVKKPTAKKIAPLPPEKPYIPFIQPKVKPPKTDDKPDMNWLMEDKSDEIRPEDTVKKSRGASAGKNIQELYGSEFGKLSAGQQEYILNNQEIMRRITQEVLTRQASVSDINGLNVNKTNIIEFYLHPNGNMSDFKFLKQSGYFILDDITKSTIEYAYAKYPRPSEKTLIRYNVFYNLARY